MTELFILQNALRSIQTISETKLKQKQVGQKSWVYYHKHNFIN